MKDFKIAAQLYTLRDFLKTPEDIEKSLKKVKEIGYNAVQVSGVGKIEPKRLKEIADSLGLTICATHTSPDRMINEFEDVVKEHKLWDCKYVGLGSMPGKYRGSKEGVLEFVKEFNENYKLG